MNKIPEAKTWIHGGLQKGFFKRKAEDFNKTRHESCESF
jgi:hypothetical protein